MEVNKREFTPREEWINWVTETMGDLVAPKGFKMRKGGIVVSRLDYLSKDRCEQIISTAVMALNVKDNRVEQDLNAELVVLAASRQKLQDQLDEARKKWFNGKEIKEIKTRIEQVGSMAIGVDRAIRLYRAVRKDVQPTDNLKVTR